MIEIWKILLACVAGLFKPQARLEAENAVLRHQLNVLRRKAPHRLAMGNWDQLTLVWFCRLFPFLFQTTSFGIPGDNLSLCNSTLSLPNLQSRASEAHHVSAAYPTGGWPDTSPGSNQRHGGLVVYFFMRSVTRFLARDAASSNE